MSGAGNGVSSALALSNAVTNLAGMYFLAPKTVAPTLSVENVSRVWHVSGQTPTSITCISQIKTGVCVSMSVSVSCSMSVSVPHNPKIYVPIYKSIAPFSMGGIDTVFSLFQ